MKFLQYTSSLIFNIFPKILNNLLKILRTYIIDNFNDRLTINFENIILCMNYKPLFFFLSRSTFRVIRYSGKRKFFKYFSWKSYTVPQFYSTRRCIKLRKLWNIYATITLRRLNVSVVGTIRDVRREPFYI